MRRLHLAALIVLLPRNNLGTGLRPPYVRWPQASPLMRRAPQTTSRVFISVSLNFPDSFVTVSLTV